MNKQELKILKEIITVLVWNEDRMSQGYSNIPTNELTKKAEKIYKKYNKK